MRKLWLAILITVLLSVLLVPSALAVDQRSGSRLVIEQSETSDDDLVFGGGTLIINGTVHGDVFAFAQSVEVSGTIDGNLVAFGSPARGPGGSQYAAHPRAGGSGPARLRRRPHHQRQCTSWWARHLHQ